MAKIKTIDLNSKEWFDKVSGNSYFSARVTVNFGMKSEKTYALPYQYGYGNSDEQAAMEYLIKNGIIKDAEFYQNAGSNEQIWSYCKRKGIIYRRDKTSDCKKRDVVAFGQD